MFYFDSNLQLKFREQNASEHCICKKNGNKNSKLIFFSLVYF